MSVEIAQPHTLTDGFERPSFVAHEEAPMSHDESLQIEKAGLGEALGAMDPAVEKIMDIGEPLASKPFETATRAMNRLPFISVRELDDHMTHTEEATLVEDTTFPINRIVGVQGFQSWAGRGIEKGKIVSKDGASSAHTVYEYAQMEQLGYVGSVGTPNLRMFKDTDGEVWAYVDWDGAHRTAAAKMRGDKDLVCNVNVTSSKESLPTVDFSVGGELLERDRRSKTLIGRLALRADSGTLIKKSIAHEQNRSKSARREENRISTSQGWTEI